MTTLLRVKRSATEEQVYEWIEYIVLTGFVPGNLENDFPEGALVVYRTEDDGFYFSVSYNEDLTVEELVCIQIYRGIKTHVHIQLRFKRGVLHSLDRPAAYFSKQDADNDLYEVDNWALYGVVGHSYKDCLSRLTEEQRIDLMTEKMS